MNNLETELETAVALARKAGAAIMHIYRTGFVIEEKLGLDNFLEPVTEADRQASQIVVAGLLDKFPDDGVLSEEELDDDDRKSKNRVWMIDPIDGTNGFVSKQGDFAVQIGLTIDGASVLGVVYEPLIERLFFAVKNQGAWMQTPDHAARRLQVSSETDFRRMTLAASRSHRAPKTTRIAEDFGFKNEIQRGSVGVKVGLLAMQECDLYIHLSARTKQWDTCAPQIILEESGGAMTDLFGEPILYNTADVQNHNGVVSSNGVSHQAAIARLKPLLAEFGRLRVKSKR